jgi:hypothetical protein
MGAPSCDGAALTLSHWQLAFRVNLILEALQESASRRSGSSGRVACVRPAGEDSHLGAKSAGGGVEHSGSSRHTRRPELQRRRDT